MKYRLKSDHTKTLEIQEGAIVPLPTFTIRPLDWEEVPGGEEPLEDYLQRLADTPQNETTMACRGVFRRAAEEIRKLRIGISDHRLLIQVMEEQLQDREKSGPGRRQPSVSTVVVHEGAVQWLVDQGWKITNVDYDQSTAPPAPSYTMKLSHWD